MTHRTRLLPLLVSVLALVQCSLPETPELKTEEQRTIYAFGAVVGEGIRQGGIDLNELDSDIFLMGVQDGMGEKNYRVVLANYKEKIDAYLKEQKTASLEKMKATNTDFLATAAKEAGATKTDSGLIINELSAGSGESPGPMNVVKVHYKGTFTNGEVFDSSFDRGEPAVFPLNRVIPCWTEAVQRMKAGGKYKIICPAELAYAQPGHPMEGKILIFDIEFLEIIDNKPVGKEPGKDEPKTDEPGADEPGKDEPETDETGADEPKTDEPGADEPGKDEPETDETGADEPRTDEPGADEPGKE